MVNDHPEVLATELRVAVFIGKHWETASLQCHIARETIAEALKISVRQVTRVVAKLERLGLLGVHRFAIGHRKDGSIAYGGTGNANTFLFPFDAVMAYVRQRQQQRAEAKPEGHPCPSEPQIRGTRMSLRTPKSEGHGSPSNSLPLQGRVGAATPPKGGAALAPIRLEPQKSAAGKTRWPSEREPVALPVPDPPTDPEERARVIRKFDDLLGGLRSNADDL